MNRYRQVYISVATCKHLKHCLLSCITFSCIGGRWLKLYSTTKTRYFSTCILFSFCDFIDNCHSRVFIRELNYLEFSSVLVCNKSVIDQFASSFIFNEPCSPFRSITSYNTLPLHFLSYWCPFCDDDFISILSQLRVCVTIDDLVTFKFKEDLFLLVQRPKISSECVPTSKYIYHSLKAGICCAKRYTSSQGFLNAFRTIVSISIERSQSLCADISVRRRRMCWRQNELVNTNQTYED